MRQVTSKRDALEEKSTGARNDYLLSLAAANANQNRYFVVDLQSTMQVSIRQSITVTLSFYSKSLIID